MSPIGCDGVLPRNRGRLRARGPPIATRRQILSEARKDALAYYREFGQAYSPEGLGWIKQAWADLRSDLKLSSKDVVQFEAIYRDAFVKETERLALLAKGGDDSGQESDG